jgi:hypothetical protein
MARYPGLPPLVAVCRELVDGCPDCQAEAEFKLSFGHECGEDGTRFISLCTVFGKQRRKDAEFHRLSHQPVCCEKCGTKLRDNVGYDVIVVKPCPSGQCRRWCCPDCGDEWASDGPVDCWSCGSYRDPQLSRIRRAYRRRRRFW